MAGAGIAPVISAVRVASRHLQMDVAPSHRGLLQAPGFLPLCWDFWSSWFGSKLYVHSSIGDTRRVICKMRSGEEKDFLGASSPRDWGFCGGLDQSRAVCHPSGPGARSPLSIAL